MASDHSTDADWEWFGKNDPYYGVLSADRFRRQALTSGVVDEFFASGDAYVERLFRVVRHHLDPDFRPRRALDFGCGVGRLAIPMARSVESVVGVDVSESMLREAADNAASRGVTNVEFVRGDDGLSRVDGTFDLVNTFIVLQHIPCERGIPLFRRLVDLVGDGGVGAIHLTFANERCRGQADYESPIWPPASSGPQGGRRHLKGLRDAVFQRVRTLVSARPRAGDSGAQSEVPWMQMNSYAINTILLVLQDAGVVSTYVDLSNHDGCYGAMFYFRKKAGAVREI